METLQIDLLILLGAMEFAVVLIAVALFFWVRSGRLARRVETLQTRLAKSVDAPEPVGFSQYLRDEVIRNQAFIDEAAAAKDETEREAAQLLEMRKQFLELELAAQSAQGNPVEFCRTIKEGMLGLIEQLRPEAQTVVETEVVEVTSQTDAEAGQTNSETQLRELRDTHEEEMDHLKQVINNQQDAMNALRSKLKENEGEIEGMDSILQKLDDFERQSLELHQSLQVLEAENERLKQVKQAGKQSGAEIVERDPAQLSGLKNMVGKQQSTINTLQDLIRELAPEASKARELQDAIEQIQRANKELDDCVAVLESENSMLRKELDEIQAYLDEEEKAKADEAEAAEAAQAEAMEKPEELMREMEIKVQELEALVEFKDAAIEEMEKQYNALQARYLAATGKKQVDA